MLRRASVGQAGPRLAVLRTLGRMRSRGLLQSCAGLVWATGPSLRPWLYSTQDPAIIRAGHPHPLWAPAPVRQLCHL